MSSTHALPIVFFNLAGEMMYILKLRLEAQKIDPQKSIKVMHDLIGRTFDKKFIDELFVPRCLYSFHDMKVLFTKIAHASIMKLNEVSMLKLFDLMTMMFKYQTLNCRTPRDILIVTEEHIDNMKSFVTDIATRKMVDYGSEKLNMTYSKFDMGEFFSIKQTILDFLQGRTIKIALLLREGKQNTETGKMCIDMNGPCPEEVDIPGPVNVFGQSGEISNTYTIAGYDILKFTDPTEYEKHPYTEFHKALGSNHFATQGSAEVSGSHPYDGEEKINTSEDMEQLARMIRGSSISGQQTFNLRLHAASNAEFNFDGNSNRHDSSSDSDSASRTHTVSIKNSGTRKSIEQQMRDLELSDRERERASNARIDTKTNDHDDNEGLDEDSDDLLDLMDSVCESKSKKK